MTVLDAGAFDWLHPMGYEHPERSVFFLLVPLGIVLYLVAMRLRNRRGMRFTNTGVLSQVLPKQRRILRHVAVVMSLLSIVTLTLAYMIPFAGDRVPRERATVVVVLDVSRSMGATDVKPNRLDAAKAEAKDFVRSLPSGYNVAVVSLSGNPGLRIPPTNDHEAVARAIDVLEMQDSTAIGDAIYAAISGVEMAPKGNDNTVAPAAIVLLSDGTNTAGRAPRQAADEAKQKKIPIYTVAYGTDTGYVDLDGKRENVRPDRELMKDIATLSGGEMLSAGSADDLKQAYANLKSKVGYDVVRTEVTARWAGLGLVFGLLAAVAAIMMAARWP